MWGKLASSPDRSRRSKVIFYGERPILSLILSLRPDTVVVGERESVKGGPMDYNSERIDSSSWTDRMW